MAVQLIYIGASYPPANNSSKWHSTNQLALPYFDGVDGVGLEPAEHGLGHAAVQRLLAGVLPGVHRVGLVEDGVPGDGGLVVRGRHPGEVGGAAGVVQHSQLGNSVGNILKIAQHDIRTSSQGKPFHQMCQNNVYFHLALGYKCFLNIFITFTYSLSKY